MDSFDQDVPIATISAVQRSVTAVYNISCAECSATACSGDNTTDSDEKNTVLVMQIVLFGAALLLNVTVVALPILNRFRTGAVSSIRDRKISAASWHQTSSGSISSTLSGRLGRTFGSQIRKRRRFFVATTLNVGTVVIALAMLVESCVMLPLLKIPGKASYVCVLNITHIIVHCSVTFGYTLVIGIHGVSSTMYLVYALLPMRSANRSPHPPLKLMATIWLAAIVLTVATLTVLLKATNPGNLCNGSYKTLALIYSTSLSPTKSKVCSWVDIVCFSYIILTKVSIIILYFKSTKVRSHFGRWSDIIWFQIFQVIQFLCLWGLMAYDIAAAVDTDNCWQTRYIIKDFPYRLTHIIYTSSRPIFSLIWSGISQRSELQRSRIYSVPTVDGLSRMWEPSFGNRKVGKNRESLMP